MWRYLPNKKTWDTKASSFNSVYPLLPDRLGAGVYDSQRQKAVFFTDTSVYSYDIDHQNVAKHENHVGLPRNLQKSIRGAIYYKNEIHVITSKTIRLFKLDSGYKAYNERNLVEEFPRLTGTITTAFSYGDLHHFFTSDRLVYVWNGRSNTWQTFGKPMETSWFACSGADTSITQNNRENQPSKHQRHRHHHHHHHHDD